MPEYAQWYIVGFLLLSGVYVLLFLLRAIGQRLAYTRIQRARDEARDIAQERWYVCELYPETFDGCIAILSSQSICEYSGERHHVKLSFSESHPSHKEMLTLGSMSLIGFFFRPIPFLRCDSEQPSAYLRLNYRDGKSLDAL